MQKIQKKNMNREPFAKEDDEEEFWAPCECEHCLNEIYKKKVLGGEIEFDKEYFCERCEKEGNRMIIGFVQAQKTRRSIGRELCEAHDEELEKKAEEIKVYFREKFNLKI